MSDIPCIYDISLINEENSIKDDVLNGKSFDILLLLLSGPKTIREVAKELRIPSFSVQLYVQRLMGVNLVRIKEELINEGRIEKIYELASNEVEILNYLKDSEKTSNSKENVELAAHQFSTLSKEVIKNINQYSDKPHKIKAFFIKADEKHMTDFKEELDMLYEKYKSLEDLDADDTYGFISILAPYKIPK